MSSPGQVVLRDHSFSGILKLAYSNYLGSVIGPNQAFDTDPMWRSLQAEEVIATFDSLAQASEAFKLLYIATKDERWNRARESALATFTATASLDHPIFFFKKETSGKALSHWGTDVRTTNPFPVLALRLPDGLVRLDIPLNDGSETELRQRQVEVYLTADSRIRAEIGLNLAGSVAIVLTTPDQTKWEAGFVCEGNSLVVEQLFGVSDFVRWSEETTWYAGLSTYTFQGATGLANQSVRNVAIAAGNSVVATFELAGNFDFAGVGLRGNFRETPSPLTYALNNNPVQLRLKDAAGWYWEKLLPVTGGQFVTLPLAWSEFQLAAEQTNTGAVPGNPSLQGAIQAVEFVAGRDPSLLAVHYLGAAPQRLLPPIMVQTCGVVSRESAFHSLLVGDVQLLPNEMLSYTPGVTPHAIASHGSEQKWRSLPLIGNQHPALWTDLGQADAAQHVYQFLAEAQTLEGPFAPAYLWRNRQHLGTSNTFIWADADFDLSWGGWQAKAALATAYGWYAGLDPLGLAQDIAIRFFKFLDTSWGDGGAFPWVQFFEETSPVAGTGNLAIVALYAQAALYANLAGGDRSLTYRILSKSLDYLLQSAQFPLSHVPESATGFEVTETITALALTLQYKSRLRYPTPSDLGDAESDFAAKLVEVSQFTPTLNLPERACYGFRFTVPVQELYD